MKALSIVGSVLVTAGAIGYVVATTPELQVWKRSSDRSRNSEREQPASGTTTTAPATTSASAPAAQGPAQAGSPASTGAAREGSKVYWIDQRCDCPLGYALMLESVLIDDKETSLTFLNARQTEVSTHPPGHEAAQFLLEMRLLGNNDRPRHELVAVRGIGLYPAWSKATTFDLVFSRVDDAATMIRLNGNGTPELAALTFTSIPIDRKHEMPVDTWQRFQAYKRCGFDGPRAIPAGQRVSFEAHGHADTRERSWRVVSGGLTVAGGAGGVTVTLEGQNPGPAELCLDSLLGDGPCTACAFVEVIPAGPAPAPDFHMDVCGGLPSREPHWLFSVASPEKGALYEWTVSGPAAIIDDSAMREHVVVKPQLRPGKFTMTLTASYASGNKASLAREVHNVYSCPDKR